MLHPELFPLRARACARACVCVYFRIVDLISENPTNLRHHYAAPATRSGVASSLFIARNEREPRDCNATQRGERGRGGPLIRTLQCFPWADVLAPPARVAPSPDAT